jgi:hypothetical protein
MQRREKTKENKRKQKKTKEKTLLGEKKEVSSKRA